MNEPTPTPFLTDDHDIVISSFVLHKLGISPKGNPTFENWESCMYFLLNASSYVHWWIGDMLNFGEKHYGKMYQNWLDKTGLDIQTLRNDKWVASNIELPRRRDNLSFDHHKEVASLEPPKQDKLLDQAEKENLTREQLRAEKQNIVLESHRESTLVIDPALWLGDCIKLLKNIPDSSVDCIITDPPYGINYQSDHRLLAFTPMTNDTKEEAQELLDKALATSSQKLKDGSHVFIFTSWQSIGWMQETIAKYFTLKTPLVWVKNNWNPGDLEGAFASRCEIILHAHKGRRHLFGERDDNIKYFNRVPENTLVHPAEKPVPLFEYLIEKATAPGETILDMFMGTGPACQAAKNKGRKYIGIEIEKKYFDIATMRLANLLPSFEPESDQVHHATL